MGAAGLSALEPGVRAVLQAGGRGERMGAADPSVPKPLVTVGGVPMVERLLRQTVSAGIRSVTVVTGWQGEQVQAHLGGLRGLPDDLDLAFLREAHPRGNIGALADLPRDERQVLLSFGDLVTNLSFTTLIAHHRAGGADITLASHYESHRLHLGELQVDGPRVTGYFEKPEKQFLICSGIAMFEPAVIDLIPADRPAGLSDLVVAAIAEGRRVIHWTHGAFWMDVNSPDERERAERALASARRGPTGSAEGS